MAKTLRQEIDRVFLSASPELAFDLYYKVKDRLAVGQDEEDMQIALERTLHRLAFIAMPLLSEEQVEEEFEGFAALAFTLPETVDLKDILRQALTHLFFQDDRNAYRDRIRTALDNSKSKITETEPTILEEKQVGTVENWLRIYRGQVGTKRASKLDYARFFSQNPEIQKLSTFEQTLIRKLVDFYEFTKLRSDDVEGFEGYALVENDDGALVQITNGEVEPVFDETDLETAKQQFAQGEIKQWQLEEILEFMPQEIRERELAKLPKRVYDFVPSDPESIQQVYQEFFEAQEKEYGLNKISLQDGDKQQLSEHLLEMTKKGNISAIQNGLYTLSTMEGGLEYLIRSDAFGKFVQARIANVASTHQQELYKQSPFSPIAIQVFMQIAFKDQSKLQDEEAAWRAFELLKKFPKNEQQYKTLVSYDLRENTLKWRYE